jgi:hypothetical protein
MPPEYESDWIEYKQRVLRELEDLNKKYDKLDDKINIIITDIAVLKTKAWIFGVLGGGIVTGVFEFIVKYIH